MKTVRNFLILAIVAIQLFRFVGDSSYNCHNYAWESSRRWLDDPAPYIESAQECNAEVATTAVYYLFGHPIHSAVYLGNGWAESKWGSCPVMVHPVYFSPYGWAVKFYR